MAYDEFKPQLWSDIILDNLDKAQVFGNLANRSFEGQIKGMGTSVKINEVGEVTTAPYSGTVNYEELLDSDKVLYINQSVYAGVTLDDVDATQSNVELMNKLSQRMAYAISDNIDQYLAGLHTEAGITVGSTSSVKEIDSTVAISTITGIARQMDEKNAPRAGRVMVLPPWLVEKLVLAKIIRDTDNSATMTNGYLGNYLGFEMYMSNNVVASGTSYWLPMFFVKGYTIAHAQQILKVEALRSETSFADKLRTLSVYGAKVLYPNTLGRIYCKAKAEAAI